MSLLPQSVTPELKAQYLLTLPAIRDRCSQVHDLAKEGKLEYFEYHPENEEKVADFCFEIIQVPGLPSPRRVKPLTDQTAGLRNELLPNPSPRTLETHRCGVTSSRAADRPLEIFSEPALRQGDYETSD